jgi:hypothetical protein
MRSGDMWIRLREGGAGQPPNHYHYRRRSMPRRSAKLDGLMPVLCVWDEVFTGLEKPKKLNKGEKASLPPMIVAILVRSGACKSI